MQKKCKCNACLYLTTAPKNMDNTKDITFEDFKNENGITFWWATTFMRFLGYQNLKSFQKAIDRATKTCITLGISHYENFMPQQRTDANGDIYQDIKLTRFACYLTAMNADNKKPEVAQAQLYFIEQTRRFEVYIQDQQEIERLTIRDELREGHKSLFAAAKKGGVENYANFQDAGYLGMYNMRAGQLAQKRNIDPKQLLEYMSRTELAANLFRITQTEERIKNFGINGQNNLEHTHRKVGAEVRQIVQQNTGKKP